MAHRNVQVPETGWLGSRGIDYAINHANVDAGASGDNVLVAGVVGKRIRVISCFVIAGGAVFAYFVDGADTDLAGSASNTIKIAESSGFVLPFNQGGWFQTGIGESLDINLSGAVSVAGSLSYIEAD